LSENLYLPIETIDLANVMDFPAVPELKHPTRQAQCLLTIGAALRDDSVQNKAAA
jgi:MSHA biogenesis protein MshI